MARHCAQCGAAIPWGAPQCVECGGYTLWRRRLATLGIAIGGGTVIAVIATIAWVSLMSPPAELRAGAEVRDFMQRLEGSADASLVAGAGRCKREVADALCIQLTEAVAELSPREREQALQRIADTWSRIANLNPAAALFVAADGKILSPG